MRRRLEYMPLEALQPAERNSKGHAEATIRASIGRFGFLDPIVIDERTGRLVSGHGRREELLRAETAGEPAPEGVTIRAGQWHVPVTRGWASRDDAHAQLAAISVNRVGELGGWDAELLETVLDAWAGAGEDLLQVGYTPEALDDLRAYIEERAQHPEREPETTTSAVRSFMLDYPLATFERMAVQMRSVREARGIESNAEVVRQLVHEADRG